MVRQRRTDWKTQGACVDERVEMFFEERYYEVAKRFCGGCRVRRKCYEAGRREEFGVWGGLTRGWLDEEEGQRDESSA